MGDRGGSSCLEAVLRGGKGSGSQSGGDAQASFALLEGFFEAGGVSLTGMSWYEAKAAIVRDAIRTYLAQPIYELIPIA